MTIINYSDPELQDALTLSEQTKTNLESELRTFESNVEKLNQHVASAENKISQITTQKEKLVSNIFRRFLLSLLLIPNISYFCFVFRNPISQIW